MGKTKNAAAAAPIEIRRSVRLRNTSRPQKPLEMKSKPAAKKGPKAKKTKPAENGSAKAEEPKAEATEAK